MNYEKRRKCKMEEILKQIGNVGFPVVVAIYLLVRMEAKLDQLTTSIISLTNVIEHGQK
jgi:hypothetical protein